MQSFLLSTASQNEIAAYDNKVPCSVIWIKLIVLTVSVATE